MSPEETPSQNFNLLEMSDDEIEALPLETYQKLLADFLCAAMEVGESRPLYQRRLQQIPSARQILKPKEPRT